ncbi:DUF6731 family protein [Virgibacillus kimchii]
MSKNKNVFFNFFRSTTYNSVRGRNERLEIHELLESIRSSYAKGEKKGIPDYKIVYTYNDDIAMLTEITFDTEHQVYHLVFERLVYNVPNRTSIDGSSEVIRLEENEYIGHEVSLIYDPENCVLMVQRNRDSLSPKGIESCLNSQVLKYEIADNFDMAIITDPDAKRKAFNQSSYRKIHAKIDGAKADGLVEKLSEMVGLSERDHNIDNIEVVLSSGIKKDDEINDQYAKQILEDFDPEDDDIKTLRIRSRPEDGDRVQTIDLIEHKIEVFDTVKIDDNRKINAYSIFDKMTVLYFGNEEFRGVKFNLPTR